MKYLHFITVGIFPFFRLIESYTLHCASGLFQYMFVSITAIIFYTKKVIHNKITSYPQQKNPCISVIIYTYPHYPQSHKQKLSTFLQTYPQNSKVIHDLQIVINKLSTMQIIHKTKHNINNCSIFIHITNIHWCYWSITFFEINYQIIADHI